MRPRGSGTRSFRPPSSVDRQSAEPGRRTARASPSTSAERARAIAPMPWRARYSRYAKPSKSSASSISRDDPQPIAGGRVETTRQPDEQAIVEASRTDPSDREREVAEDELEPILARPRVVDDRADDLVLVAVGQAGDRRRTHRRLRRPLPAMRRARRPDRRRQRPRRHRARGTAIPGTRTAAPASEHRRCRERDGVGRPGCPPRRPPRKPAGRTARRPRARLSPPSRAP